MPTLQLANAPCSWGTLEFKGLGGEEIGFQQMLDELVDAGYAGTELGGWGYMPTEPAALQAELDARSLSMRGAFVPVALRDPAVHDEGVARSVRTACLLAAVATEGDPPLLVLSDKNGADATRRRHAGRITKAMGLSEKEWRVVADGANRIACAVLQETGIRTVFHHHCAGFVETPDEIALFLSLTDPDTVGLVFDTGHYAYGAGSCDAVGAGIDRFADRIWYVHFKDCEPEVATCAREQGWDYFEAVGHGVFCELGHGCVDFEAVLQRLEDCGYKGWIVVEQDVLPGMGAPRDSAARNRAYLRTLGL